MSWNSTRLDELDLDFLQGVQRELEHHFDEMTALEILSASSLIDRLKEDPEYVHHYDEAYWANFVRNEAKTKQTKQ